LERDGEAVSILQAFAEDGYRVGDFAAIRYDKARTDIFPEGWIGEVYFRLKGGMYNRKSKTDSILEKTFCGMTQLDYDSIVRYLSTLQIIAVGKWVDGSFLHYGFTFITITTGNATDRMGFVGYAFYPDAWGCPETELMTMLALCYLFHEFKFSCIHGIRYPENQLTARFMRRFGFKDDGIVPKYMLKGDKLVSAVVSSCLREDFERYVEEKLISGLSESGS
jgi:RimJ/RimL family protein N-acetyltransferase